jgi:1,2-diacylglycerol 3-beta-glucosyltransferase
VMSLVRNRAPMLMPLTSLMLTLSFVGMVQGLRQVKRLQHQRQTAAADNDPADPDLDPDVSPAADRLLAWEVLRGMVYMLHWLPVVASVTARMAVRAKRLKWVKTVHHGN